MLLTSDINDDFWFSDKGCLGLSVTGGIGFQMLVSLVNFLFHLRAIANNFSWLLEVVRYSRWLYGTEITIAGQMLCSRSLLFSSGPIFVGVFILSKASTTHKAV